MDKPSVTLREVLTARTGAATRVLWTVANHPNTKVVGTKVADQWVAQREGAGASKQEWLEEVRTYVERQLQRADLPAADTSGDVWYEVNTFTAL